MTPDSWALADLKTGTEEEEKFAVCESVFK